MLPWDGKSSGEFIYRAIPCSGNAPMNNISSNLPTYNALIPGSRSPASTRSHPFRFTVRGGKMIGTIQLTVCKLGPGPTKDEVADASRPRITINFQADASCRNGEETVFSGAFIVHVVASDSPGLHKLVVTVGDRDPAPVEITVPVVLPWYRQPMATLRTLPAELGVALAVLLVGGSGVAAYRQRSRQRRGEVAPGLSTHASAFGGSPPC